MCLECLCEFKVSYENENKLRWHLKNNIKKEIKKRSLNNIWINSDISFHYQCVDQMKYSKKGLSGKGNEKLMQIYEVE
jgi:hypothetical protein